MVTTTTATTTSNSIHSSSTSNGLSNNANMNSSTSNRNAPAAAGARVTGLSATSSVWANIVKGEPNVVVAAPPPTSSPKKAASSSSSPVSQVNQKIDSSATASVADDSNTTDVKSASTSSSKSSCNHNDNNINCTSDGATIMGVTEKEPSGSPSASDSAVADTNAAAPAASSTPSTTSASVKKPAAAAWKKPSFNGTTIANTEAGLVIGDAFSWPALSESATNNVRGSTKSPSPSPTPSYSPSPLDSSLKPLSLSQVSHVATSSSQTQKQSTNHANHNPTANHASSNRQRSTKRGTNTASNSGGAGASMNGGLPSQSQSSSAGASVEKPQKNSSGTLASTVPDPSMKDSSHKMNNLERGSKGRGGFAPQPDQSSQQHNSSFRRGSGGPHPRGDGHSSYRQNQNHMGRREHDHRDWNSHRSFNGRDAQQHQQMHPRMVNPRNNYIRPPPGNVNGAFIPPQPVPLRPYGNAIGYPDMPSPVYFVPDPLRGVPFLPAAPLPMFFPGADPNLYPTIAKQIEYYFSSVNLCKDIYLRQNMDEQGWVPVSLIAGFHRVEQLMKGIPNSIQFILDAVRASTIVETKGDMIRKRNDWMNWILPPTATTNFAPIHVPQLVGVPKGGNSTNPDMNNHLQSSNGEGTSEGTL